MYEYIQDVLNTRSENLELDVNNIFETNQMSDPSSPNNRHVNENIFETY